MAGFGGSNTEVSLRDLWRTPPWVFQYYNRIFKYRADVAATAENALCDQFITEQENALEIGWGDILGTVWCNPPYSDIAPWVRQAEAAWEMGTGSTLLLPAETAVGWFEEALESVCQVRFITGQRVGFIHPETGKAIEQNPKGSILLVWLPEGKKPIDGPVTIYDSATLMKKVNILEGL